MEAKKTVLIKKRPTIVEEKVTVPEVAKSKMVNQELARVERQAIHAVFMQTFPVFREKKPLRIGIHLDLYKQFPEFSHRNIASVMRWHTSGRLYLKNILAGTDRFDLTGDPVGTITDEARADAKKRLNPPKK